MMLHRGRLLAVVLLVALISSGCMRSPEARSASYIREGKILLEKKDPARAILQFRNAVQTTPKNAEAFYQLGLAYLAAKDIRVRTALEPDPPLVALDRVQVQQVFVNLIRNGIEAMDAVVDGARALEILASRDGRDTIRVEGRVADLNKVDDAAGLVAVALTVTGAAGRTVARIVVSCEPPMSIRLAGFRSRWTRPC